MNKDKYTFSKIFLTFKAAQTEKEYHALITGRTLLFCRISWALIVIFGTIFGLLDRQFFGSNADTVQIARGATVTIAAIIFTLSFFPGARKFLHLSSTLFILVLGFFSTFLVAMSESTKFTPYFTSFLFAFAGIFTTVGLGFRFSFFAMALNLVMFELTLGILFAVPLGLFLVYTFFLGGIFLVYSYIGYMVELFSRENFAMSARLQDSLNKIKTLSGLLPICAHCKKIRDDKGYWSQVDEYFRDHGNVTFSHSLCPDCVQILHPNLKIKA